MRQNAAGRWRVGEGYQVNARSLQLESARFLHESLLVPVLMYGSETVIWREKERSRISAIQMDNLRGLLGIRSPEWSNKALVRGDAGCRRKD